MKKQITIVDLSLGKLRESVKTLPNATQKQAQEIKNTKRLIRLTQDEERE